MLYNCRSLATIIFILLLFDIGGTQETGMEAPATGSPNAGGAATTAAPTPAESTPAPVSSTNVTNATNPAPGGNATTPTPTDDFTGDLGWLRVCGSGKDKAFGVVTADKCSAGYWFKEPVKISCVCGHGVWVFAKGWCDKGARIILANHGSCFFIDKDVKYIRFLGNPLKAYMPYHFQATTGFEYVQELPSMYEFTYFHPKYDQHVGAIFPDNQIESQNSRRCVEFNGTTRSAVAMKYFVDRLPYRQTPFCFKPHGQNRSETMYDDFFEIDGYFGLREKGKVGGPPPSWKAKDDKCAKQCPPIGKGSYNRPPMNDSSFPPDYFDPLLDEYLVFFDPTPKPAANASASDTSSNSTNATNVPETKPKDKEMTLEFPLFQNRTPLGCDKVHPTYNITAKFIREIHEETKRMVLTNLAYSLKTIRTPEVDVEDYMFFQMARKIMLTACPNEELPHTLITGMLRMFRVAVKDSLKFYPFEHRQGPRQSYEIMQLLKQCLSTAQPFTFEYKYQSSTNESEYSQCGNEVPTVKYTYGGKANRILLTKIPKQLRTNIEYLDLPVETAWKTVLFTHYYCSRHFTNQSMSDYSYFYDKMEMFFNRWMQHRWFFPGQSLHAYKYMFQMYNLTKFGEQLDQCVGASRSFSHYKKWLRRPQYVKYCGGTTFQSMDDKAGKKKPRLDAIAPTLTEFGNRAYCLPYWHAPVSNPGINYDPRDSNDGCVQYKSWEWEDDLTPNTMINWNNKMV